MPKSLPTSSLTDRYQTTIPEPVRQALGLQKRDRLQYTVQQGQVILTRLQKEHDPALLPFLTLLERDLEAAPQRLTALGAADRDRLLALTGDLDPDLDAALDPADE